MHVMEADEFKEIEYYDDEELDMYKGHAADDYSEEEKWNNSQKSYIQ